MHIYLFVFPLFFFFYFVASFVGNSFTSHSDLDETKNWMKKKYRRTNIFGIEPISFIERMAQFTDEKKKPKQTKTTTTNNWQQ